MKMSKEKAQRKVEEMSEDLLKKIHKQQTVFVDPLPRSAPEYLERTIDKDLLWKEYELHIDLYKHYMRIVATFNVFFYGVTGAVISYSLNAGNPQVRWALVFPMVMSVFFAVVFFNSWRTFKDVEKEIECIAYAFGFQRPEVSTLTQILLSSVLMYCVTFVGLAIAIWLAHPWR